MALIRVLTAALLLLGALATAAPERTDSSPLPGMPPVLDPHDIYAAARPGALSATVRGDVYRIYVPNSHSASVDVIDPATFKIVEHFKVGKEPQHVTPRGSVQHVLHARRQARDRGR